MQRIVLDEGESVNHMVLSWAENGKACVFIPTEIEESMTHAYALARRERETRPRNGLDPQNWSGKIERNHKQGGHQ